MPLPNVSFEEAIAAGGVVAEHRLHTRNENYSVHVVLPNNEVFIYTNISKQRLKPHVKGPISTVPAPAPNPSYRASTQPRSSATSGSTGSETFEDVMRSGGQIVEVKKFTTYGVYMRMPTDGRIVHCWNISQDRVDAARRHIAIETDFTPPTKPHSGHSSAATSGGSKRSQNPSFEECIQQCATIVRVTPHVFYSIHVQRPNGRVENFNRVSHEKYEAYRHLRLPPNSRSIHNISQAPMTQPPAILTSSPLSSPLKHAHAYHPYYTPMQQWAYNPYRQRSVAYPTLGPDQAANNPMAWIQYTEGYRHGFGLPAAAWEGFTGVAIGAAGSVQAGFRIVDQEQGGGDVSDPAFGEHNQEDCSDVDCESSEALTPAPDTKLSSHLAHHAIHQVYPSITVQSDLTDQAQIADLQEFTSFA